MKILKDELLKENTELKTLNANIKSDDYNRREQFSRLLGGRMERMAWDMSARHSKPMSWEEIFFSIGELRADANYSCLIQSREEMRREIEELKNNKNKEIKL